MPARAESPAPTAPAARRALVADDSLIARHFLARMLETHGFHVQTVERAADLFEALAHRWDIVWVDVEMPDGRGTEMLTRVRERVGASGPVVVALVRDEEDRQAAERAGVTRTVRKPFDLETIASLLFHLGLATLRD